MSLKQYKLIEGIKEDIRLNKNNTLKDIAINKAGYSFKARNMYRRNTKRHILEELSKLGYSREDLIKRFQLGADLTLKKGDYTNYLRANEDIARMEGQFLDKSEVKNVNPDKIIIAYGNKSSPDAKKEEESKSPTENENCS